MCGWRHQCSPISQHLPRSLTTTPWSFACSTHTLYLLRCQVTYIIDKPKSSQAQSQIKKVNGNLDSELARVSKENIIKKFRIPGLVPVECNYGYGYKSWWLAFVVDVSCRGLSRAQPCDGVDPVSGARERGQSSSRTSCPGGRGDHQRKLTQHQSIPQSYKEKEARYEIKVCPKTRKN